MNRITLSAALLSLVACSSPPTLHVSLVPQPQSVAVEPGSLVLNGKTRIVAATPGTLPVAQRLAQDLRAPTGLALPVVESSGLPARRGDIVLDLDPALAHPQEGYSLVVHPSTASITASDAAGLFNGTQTLRQLLPTDAVGRVLSRGTVWELPRVQIQDAPRFGWRAHMLDVARHFFTLDEVKQLIDVMALHKLNRLHLHLSDDQGWRVEITGWPELTEVGGSTEVGGGEGGFYTQAEYRELVAYADERFVTIVPEIDFPGHCNAALASVPSLNPDGVAPDLYTGTSVGFSTLNLQDDATLMFVREVWTEVAEMTTGPWLHVGADESHATDPEDYDAFVPWLQQEIEALDKTFVGWDEVGTTDISGPFLAQYWLNRDRAISAVDRGGQIISSPAAYAYLDMAYDEDTEVGAFWAGFTDVQDGYEWDPVPDGLDEDDVVGVEAPLWTESVQTWDHAELLTWPRLAGIAEIGWAAEPEPWEAYSQRLAVHGQRLEALEVGFYRSELVDWVDASR